MKAFFDTIRPKLGPVFNQKQVEGFNTILALTDSLPLMHQAYMLATVWHECAGTMQPITERGAKSYFDKYEPGTRIGKALGNTIKGDGARFKGRGYVQLTGRVNYVKFAKVVGEDIVAMPDLALRPDIAAKIMMTGMLNGSFTGKKLSNYTTYEGMRRVINGTDKASMIAGYARLFEAALLARSKALQAVPVPKAPVQPETPQPVSAPLPATPKPWWKAWLGL